MLGPIVRAVPERLGRRALAWLLPNTTLPDAAQGLIAAGEVEQRVIARAVAELQDDAARQSQPTSDVHVGTAVGRHVQGAIDRHAVGQQTPVEPVVGGDQGVAARGRNRPAVDRPASQLPRAGCVVQGQRLAVLVKMPVRLTVAPRC